MHNYKPKHSKMLVLFIVLTLCFIWGNSLMPASISSKFSGWINGLLGTLLGGTGGSEELSCEGALRKFAHASEFGLLGTELALLMKSDLKSKLSSLTLFGLGIALIDETIQLFSIGRSGKISDVWIDLSGFVFGVLLIWLIVHVVQRRREKNYNKE